MIRPENEKTSQTYSKLPYLSAYGPPAGYSKNLQLDPCRAAQKSAGCRRSKSSAAGVPPEASPRQPFPNAATSASSPWLPARQQPFCPPQASPQPWQNGGPCRTGQRIPLEARQACRRHRRVLRISICCRARPWPIPPPEFKIAYTLPAAELRPAQDSRS